MIIIYMGKKWIFVAFLFLLVFGAGTFVLKNKNNIVKVQSPFAEMLDKEYIYTDNGQMTDITIKFSEREVFGFGGINKYSTIYSINGNGDIILKPISSPMAASSIEKMKKESKYFKLLNDVQHIKLNGEGLILTTKENAELIFVEKIGK